MLDMMQALQVVGVFAAGVAAQAALAVAVAKVKAVVA